MFNHVLVPLDGSPVAERAIAYAMLLPVREITLLMVIPNAETPGYDWLTDVAEQEHHDQQQNAAETYLEAVASARRSRNLIFTPVIAQGDPGKEIISAAKEVSLILMTNHGYGANSTHAYGQTVDRVARYANKPLLVVRGQSESGAAPSLRRIVVPLDGSDAAEAAAPLAMEVASQTGVPLHLISVVDPALLPAGSSEFAVKHAGDYLASEAERLRAHAIDVTCEVNTGFPAAQLIASVRADDLIVISAFGSGTGERWLLGGVADKLIRSAPAPVLVVRPPS